MLGNILLDDGSVTCKHQGTGQMFPQTLHYHHTEEFMIKTLRNLYKHVSCHCLIMNRRAHFDKAQPGWNKLTKDHARRTQ